MTLKSHTEVYQTYFSRKLAEHGESLGTLDYGSPESQLRKFEVLYEGLRRDSRPIALLDLGCGFGDLLTFLRRHHVRLSSYTGIDLVPGIVEIAAKKHPQGRFRVRDILTQGLDDTCDYAIANGIFYLKTRDNEGYLHRTIQLLWNSCRRGVLFSARSRLADRTFIKRERHLYQYDPSEVLDFCLQLSRATVLRHDYLPHEFTIYMYREDRK